MVATSLGGREVPRLTASKIMRYIVEKGGGGQLGIEVEFLPLPAAPP